MQFHPDRLEGEHSSEAESGMMKFLEVDAAWKILGDQNSRRAYDLQRRGESLLYRTRDFKLLQKTKQKLNHLESS